MACSAELAAVRLVEAVRPVSEADLRAAVPNSVRLAVQTRVVVQVQVEALEARAG